MNIERLEKKFLAEAEKFKSRANKSPTDLKRHDLILPDEQKMMWRAYYDLHWSFAKIAEVLNRGPITVEKQVKKLQNTLTEQKEKQREREQTLRQQQQIEHIKNLRELAAGVREDVQRIPNSGLDKFVDSEYMLFTQIAFKLVNAPDWVWLSAHLGDKAREIELLAEQCGENPIKVSLTENHDRINNAKQLLMDFLYPIAVYGDTKEWEHWGLKATCPWCPAKG